ncbi:glycosyltransferase [Microbacterium sp. zg.B48]|uniref:glycosyltransferase n=1 Tax=Microbacterium sp. zg.B48 TaxID=2969408 RepID=UPI00214C0AB8|nr:glycosyltransferase [Microbacterium sp. zg.B48]MCR2764231.1 glycosyltransferase [Microbacterium sp. zg.B48]
MPSVAIIGTRGYPSYYGGFETAVRKLAPYLADAGWDVTVYSRPGTLLVDDPSRDERIRSVETWGMEKKSLSTLSFGLTAARHAARAKPDAALVMNVANGYWLPILKRAGVPTLVNVDGIEWDRAKWGKLAKAVFHTGARWTAKHATRLVYDSQEIARRWNNEFGLQGEFIPYGGDLLDEVLPVEPGLEHRGYVLAVARFVPENTIPEFFEAAREIAKRTDVVIVGSSGYGGELDETAARLSAENDRIHWLGHISDDRRLFSLWQHAGVYFHGHSVGGTNPALVQAMACGAPVVARDTAYNREVLGGLGRFIPADAHAITEAVTRLLGDRRALDQLAVEAIARANAMYTWDAANSKYEKALRQLAER